MDNVNTNFSKKITEELFVNDDFTKFYYTFKNENRTVDGYLDYSDKKWNQEMKIAVAKAALSKIKTQSKQLVLNGDAIVFDLIVRKLYSSTDAAQEIELKYYDNYVKRFIGNKNIILVTPEDIEDILEYVKRTSEKFSSFVIVSNFISKVFVYALNKGYIVRNPMKYVNIDSERIDSLSKYLKDKISEVYNVVNIEFKDEPIVLAFYLLIFNGKAIKHILKLKWEMINFNENYYKVKRTKLKSHYLHPAVKEELLKAREQEGFIFKESDETFDKFKEISFRINKYIPDFSLSKLEYFVGELKERESFNSNSFKNESTKLLPSSKKIKPKLNIGKFSKKA